MKTSTKIVFGELLFFNFIGSLVMVHIVQKHEEELWKIKKQQTEQIEQLTRMAEKVYRMKEKK